MKVMCIEPRVYNVIQKIYKNKNVYLTQGKIYKVEGSIIFDKNTPPILGYGHGLHYYITNDYGFDSWYYYGRFKIYELPINITIL